MKERLKNEVDESDLSKSKSKMRWLILLLTSISLVRYINKNLDRRLLLF